MLRSLPRMLSKSPPPSADSSSITRVRPRSRLAAIQSKRGADLGLDFFLKRSKSRALYRDFMRLIYQIERVSGDDGGILGQVRVGFRKPLEESMVLHRTRDLEDEWNKRMEVGKREYGFLRAAAGGDRHGAANGDTGGGGWMDESTPDDQRGRVGEQWPWD
ncbi:hypothetical protein TrVE_jg11360 [Triparma verrucosa]|uniref:Uncharacterized protein n=1 Tax=Triparma verrucosa TaxID=1606542 RepID=A0A9W7FK47_9STRA|nr:hypothetical protein TrVE_jg11360 [Triparma verrucosa]